MYSLEQLLKGFKRPRLAAFEVQSKVYDWYFGCIYSHSGTDYMEADWDNLLILDACRYDAFEELNHLDGELSVVQSPASETESFLRAIADGRSFPDTVYITANPQITKIDTRFHEMHFLWESLWDDEVDTVRPEDVTEFTLSLLDRYSDKRLIVHYIQPHIPFIGPTGRQLDQAPFQGGTLERAQPGEDSVWQQLKLGEMEVETARQAYRENLELALDAVEPLVESLVGKTVVTSDHGNAFGEWGIYGHPRNRPIAPITTVPWLEILTDSRREIVAADSTVSPTEVQEQSVKGRLEALGYV